MARATLRIELFQLLSQRPTVILHDVARLPFVTQTALPHMQKLRFLILLACVGCSRVPANAPNTAEKPKVEADLAFTHLSKKAYTSLAITTQSAVLKETQERLTLTGWIMARPGNEVTLTAPAAGYVRLASGGAFPIAGDRVAPKRELLRLKPVLSPSEQIQISSLKRSFEMELKKAETTVAQTQSEYQRVKNLYDRNSGSKQEYELALKARDHALEEREAARDKLKLFDLAEEPICSPQSGNVLQVHVGVGQYVPASAPLVTVVDLSTIWVRVPIPEYDLPRIDPAAKVSITLKNTKQEREGTPPFLTARPTGRVAQVDPLKHTADIWYELEGADRNAPFVKDQMVAVQAPIGTKAKAVVVPYSAIVFDAHGHGWIYVERPMFDGKHRFERRPVELVGAEEDLVIVRSSLAGGEPVVTRGAAILFSRDFHKTPLAVDDD